jgi:hypothetical protein
LYARWVANPDHIEIIRKGVAEWNQWRINNDILSPDLSEAKLQRANLSDSGLFRANLSGVNLGGVDLVGADLSGANLRGANLSDADLSGANLADTELNFATLKNAALRAANLRHADLSQANLIRANLIEANLSEVELIETNLSDSDLKHAKFSWANFGKTILGNSNLHGAKGLGDCRHRGPSVIDYRTLAQSGPLPLSFLRGCGLPEIFIEYLPSLQSQGIEFYSCFISYSHHDKAFARRLHDTLQGRGIRCWLDEKQLRGGDDILDHVDRGIRLWDKVLLCCSKNSLTSGWVETELDKALDKEQTLRKERGEKVYALIPLDLDGYLLNGWQSSRASIVKQRLAIDFNGWAESHTKCEEKIEEVVRALRSDDHARERPVEFYVVHVLQIERDFVTVPDHQHCAASKTMSKSKLISDTGIISSHVGHDNLGMTDRSKDVRSDHTR